MVLALEMVEHPHDVAVVDLVHDADLCPDLPKHILLLDLVLIDLLDCEDSATVLVGYTVHLPIGTLFLLLVRKCTRKSFHSKSSSFVLLCIGNIAAEEYYNVA